MVRAAMGDAGCKRNHHGVLETHIDRIRFVKRFVNWFLRGSFFRDAQWRICLAWGKHVAWIGQLDRGTESLRGVVYARRSQSPLLVFALVLWGLGCAPSGGRSAVDLEFPVCDMPSEFELDLDWAVKDGEGYPFAPNFGAMCLEPSVVARVFSEHKDELGQCLANLESRYVGIPLTIWPAGKAACGNAQ